MTSSRTVNPHLLHTLFRADDIDRRVRELAENIRNDISERPLTVLVVLKGAFVFAADLVRVLGVPLKIEFICVSSYGTATVSSHQTEILLEPKDLSGRFVLVVDDICDTGYTMQCVKKRALELGADSVKTCTLLDKPSRREVDCAVDYAGFVIPDVFVAGYGIDCAGEHRELPDIYVVET